MSWTWKRHTALPSSAFVKNWDTQPHLSPRQVGKCGPAGQPYRAGILFLVEKGTWGGQWQSCHKCPFPPESGSSLRAGTILSSSLNPGAEPAA